MSPASARDLTVRVATADDLHAILGLYAELHPEESALASETAAATFDRILEMPGMSVLLLEHRDDVLGTAYLNVIPNLTREAAPYAIIENVVVTKDARGQGLGKTLMAATLDAVWRSGCYKAMLLTGSRNSATHGFYRACGFDPDSKTAYHLRRPPARVRPPSPQDEEPRD